jgi:small subunit ribosomal protein S4
VNGHRVDIPSYQIKVGDVIRVKNRAKSLDLVRGAMAESNRDVPDFLSRSESQIPEGIVSRLPTADEISIPVQTQLIVELCSR